MKKVERQFTVTDFHTLYKHHWDTNFVFDGESHDFWEIVFLKSGKVECTENENVYVLSPNDMIIHAPMEFHRIKNYPKNTSDVIVCTFAAEGDLPENIKNGIFNLEYLEKEKFLSTADTVDNFLHKPGCDNLGQEAADNLSSFLIQLSKSVAAPRKTDSASAQVYQNLVTDMTERVCENLSLRDFAITHNISISYIKFLFASYAGVTPKTYYRRLRTLHAAKLLEENKSISYIVDVMNFSSPNYFTSFFKSQTGRNPSEYKALHRKK